MSLKTAILSAIAAGVIATTGTALAQDIKAGETVPDLPDTELQVVGSLNNLTAYLDFEKPFWTETLPELSDGHVTATVKGYPELGLKGPEIMRLIEQGVMPIGAATIAYFTSDNAINAAIDLPGTAPDAETARKVTDAFLPVLQDFYEDQGVKVLGIATYPAQVLFCNAKITGLKDIKGKKVRAAGRAESEFIEALGGTAVTIAFPEVVPALQNGVVDCAVTGSMSGYSAKWYEVSTHLLALPITWNQIIYAANKDYWDKLDPRVQDFVQANFTDMVDAIWDDAADATQEGYDCNTGADACERDEQGKMTLVEPGDDDFATLARITEEVVIPRWAKSCSDDCVQAFNETIGPVLDIEAKK